MNTMKKSIFIIILCSLGFVSFGQSIERQVMGSAGEAVQNGTAGLSYTVGQQATASQIISAVKLTQGFQQADLEESSIVLDLSTSIKALVFPNPTVNKLHLKSDLYTLGIDQLNYKVFDLHGKLVFSGNIASNGGEIDVSSLAKSTYTLVLKSKDLKFNQRIRFVKA